MSQSDDTPPPGDPQGRADAPGATGLTRRRQRLSDADTARRMLDAALAQVHRAGLTVSLDHIPFEEVIRDAGVSRSAAYRRWPYKDQFVADLLRELAAATSLDAVIDEAAGLARVRSIVGEHLDWLDTPARRHALGTELVRLAWEADFEAVCASVEWRTYLALHATFLSLADSALRDEVHDALARSERSFVERIARNYAALVELIGYRLKPGSGASFELLAELASASFRGLVIMSLSNAELATRRVAAQPFGALGTELWSMAALGGGALAMSFLEPDPAVVWDDARRAAIAAATA